MGFAAQSCGSTRESVICVSVSTDYTINDTYIKIRRLFRRLGHPAGFRDTLPPPQASASDTALRRSRRPAGGSQVLVCMAQEHEGHAERLDPGYRIMEKKKKEKTI